MAARNNVFYLVLELISTLKKKRGGEAQEGTISNSSEASPKILPPEKRATTIISQLCPFRYSMHTLLELKQTESEHYYFLFVRLMLQ